MATSKRKDSFISKIVKDPANPPKTILLRGYLGDSSEAGYTRLYQDAQLNSYVEVPDDAILHEEAISSTPLGETYVWIKQDAQVIHGEAGPQRTKATFFEGPIAAAAARAPVTGLLGCALPPPQTQVFACQVTNPFNACQTPVVACELDTAFRCQTPKLICPPVTNQFHVCQTPVVPCQLDTAFGCQTPKLACPPVTNQFHVCQTPVVPCQLDTAFGCQTPKLVCPPVTNQFHVCQTPVVPCQLDTAFGCQTPKLVCPPVTNQFHACQTPVVACEFDTAFRC